MHLLEHSVGLTFRYGRLALQVVLKYDSRVSYITLAYKLLSEKIEVKHRLFHSYHIQTL